MCLDIETQAGRPESVEEYIRSHWWPNEAWTPDTIGKRFKEAIARWELKRGLLDAGGIAVIALNWPGQRVVLHRLQAEAPRVTDYANAIFGFATERELLAAFREFIRQNMGEETLWVGHNIKAFDLPRLRLAMLRAGLQLPAALGGHQPLFDSMREFCRAFSIERSEMVGLSEVLEKLGIPSHKELVDGSQIDELIAKGEFETILHYAALDVMAETEVFLRLTGRSTQLA